MWNMRDIAWLSLSGLQRQVAPCEWEVLVIEERTVDAMGEEAVMNWQSRLEEAGCQRIEYVGIDQHVPLSRKWKMMGEMADPHSTAFLLQGADDYPQPYRIAEAHHWVELEGFDWADMNQGIFYDIETGGTFVHTAPRTVKHPTGRDMAVQTELLRACEMPDASKAVDREVYWATDPVRVKHWQSACWKQGFCTWGRNKISRARGKGKQFESVMDDVMDQIPEDVMMGLRVLKAEG
jgi:hypothetical protein